MKRLGGNKEPSHDSFATRISVEDAVADERLPRQVSFPTMISCGNILNKHQISIESSIQYIIELAVVETQEVLRKIGNVILTRQTCTLR